MNKSDEIKVWQTQSAEHKVAGVLMLDKVSFSWSEEDGLVFTAPGWHVEKLGYRLITAYGCRKRPVFTEIK